MFLANAIFFTGMFLLPRERVITLNNNPLKGNIESLRYQNAMIDSLKIPRVKTEGDIKLLWQSGKLLRVPDAGIGYYISRDVRPNTRFLRPEAKRYLECFSRNYHLRFGKKFKITSLCRTELTQRYLKKAGISFADANGGETRSAHLACTAFDISLRDMSEREIHFVTEQLVYDRADGKIEPFLELLSRNFHVAVFHY